MPVDVVAGGERQLHDHRPPRCRGHPHAGCVRERHQRHRRREGRLTVRRTAAAPAVDVLANGEAAFTNLSNPNEASADLPAGTISASVVPAGAADPVVIGPADLGITDGTSLIVYAVSSLDAESLTVLTESIEGLGTAPTPRPTPRSPSRGRRRAGAAARVGPTTRASTRLRPAR